MGFSGSSILYDSGAETEIGFDESIAGSSIDVEATAHCWHITEDQNNDPVSIWIPAPPEELRAAYSVHVRNNLYTSVEEKESPGLINIYPNPTTDQLTIAYSVGTGTSTVEVLDVLGRKMTIFNVSNEGSYVMDCSNWAIGVYTVSILGEKTIATERFTIFK